VAVLQPADVLLSSLSKSLIYSAGQLASPSSILVKAQRWVTGSGERATGMLCAMIHQSCRPDWIWIARRYGRIVVEFYGARPVQV